MPVMTTLSMKEKIFEICAGRLDSKTIDKLMGLVDSIAETEFDRGYERGSTLPYITPNVPYVPVPYCPQQPYYPTEPRIFCQVTINNVVCEGTGTLKLK